MDTLLPPNTPIDLTNCDREPIHIPGRIQPFGMLVVLSRVDLTILQVSANIAGGLAVAPEALLGRPVDALLGAEEVATLRAALVDDQLYENPLYVFLADGTGVVIAEARRPDCEAFLGLHYPASDIPQQARALYMRNWLRLVPTVDYTPVALIPDLNPLTGKPLDMSYAVLRSVSPLHLEYLVNMGVRASMSISLVVDGRLWGLIACHHETGPRSLSYDLRTACEFLGRFASAQIADLQHREEDAAIIQRAHIHAALIERAATSPSW
ncbi:MAG: GAF domain-containing protein [Chloroflexales bacterium]|nr:GAF domain-containing protein [Chloroflexales bacterium]